MLTLRKSRVYVGDLNTQQSALHLTKFQQVVHNFSHETFRNGKRITGVTARRCSDRRVDADQLSFEINKRATTVARINCRVGLYKGFYLKIIDAVVKDADVSRASADD